MVSMFFCFISVMLELAVSSVNLAKAWIYASRSSYIHTHTQNDTTHKSEESNGNKEI